MVCDDGRAGRVVPGLVQFTTRAVEGNGKGISNGMQIIIIISMTWQFA